MFALLPGPVTGLDVSIKGQMRVVGRSRSGVGRTETRMDAKGGTESKVSFPYKQVGSCKAGEFGSHLERGGVGGGGGGQGGRGCR